MGRWQALKGGPLMIVIGELLFVVCSACYLVWWTITFRPSAQSSSGGFFLAGAVLGGLGALLLLAIGIAALIAKASAVAVGATIVGGVVVGVLLLFFTSQVLHRPVTTELPLIIIWATAQLAAGMTLRTAGVLRGPGASAWIALVVIATLVGLVCYLIFYQLGPIPAYWIGMVPLAVDGVVAATLAAIAALAPSP